MSVYCSYHFVDAPPHDPVYPTGTGPLHPVWCLVVRVQGAASDPGVNDDILDGWAIGSVWINTTEDTVWVCVDNVAGAASWIRI